MPEEYNTTRYHIEFHRILNSMRAFSEDQSFKRIMLYGYKA
jgi:hypothetical protein